MDFLTYTLSSGPFTSNFLSNVGDPGARNMEEV